MIFYDSIGSLNDGRKLTEEEKSIRSEVYRNLLKKFKNKIDQFEFLTFEAPGNNYQPPPPDGFFYMRSRKSRYLIKLVNGKIPDGDVLNKIIQNKEYIKTEL